MDIDVILFDWGGTLAQVVSQNDRLREGATTAAQCIVKGDQADQIDDFVRRVLSAEADAAGDRELREADLRERLCAWAAGVGGCSEAAVDRAMDALCEAWQGSLEVFEGIPETLAELQRRGHAMGLVSNCMMPPPVCRDELERLGLAPHLDFAVFSSEVGYRKPSSKIYQAAIAEARRLRPGVAMDRMLFVGDSPAFDVSAPARLGMKTALVACRKGIWPAGDYADARPDIRIDSVAELPAILK